MEVDRTSIWSLSNISSIMHICLVDPRLIANYELLGHIQSFFCVSSVDLLTRKSHEPHYISMTHINVIIHDVSIYDANYFWANRHKPNGSEITMT